MFRSVNFFSFVFCLSLCFFGKAFAKENLEKPIIKSSAYYCLLDKVNGFKKDPEDKFQHQIYLTDKKFIIKHFVKKIGEKEKDIVSIPHSYKNEKMETVDSFKEMKCTRKFYSNNVLDCETPISEWTFNFNTGKYVAVEKLGEAFGEPTIYILLGNCQKFN